MIREAVEKDYKDIYRLGKLLHENFKNVYALDELTKKEYFHALVYEKEKEVIGFLIFTYLEKNIDVYDIVVDPKYRRKKVASNLLDYLITNSKPNDQFYLEVSVANQAAISLYEKFAFKKIYTRKKYYGDIDAYIMERVNENE